MTKQIRNFFIILISLCLILLFATCKHNTTVEPNGQEEMFTVMNWLATDHSFTTSTENADVTGAFGGVAILGGCKSKAINGVCEYIQLNKNGSLSTGISFYVPLNANKIIVNAKCDTSTGENVVMSISTSTEEWKTTQPIGKEYADYEFSPDFTIVEDEEGNALTRKTIVIYNSDETNALNITSIKVIAPTAWEVEEIEAPPVIDSDTGDQYEEEDNSGDVTVPDTEGEVSTGSINVIKSEGWLNSAYIEFEPYSNAVGYIVKVDGEAIAPELIRTYPEYIRADALGLKAGSHEMSVQAVTSSMTVTDATTIKLNVIDHDRSGFAFTGTDTPGAYKMDGTLKDNADVIYVTKDNAKTVTYTYNNGKTDVTATGLQGILGESNVKHYTKPLCVRIIGLIKLEDVDSNSSGWSSAEGLQIKNNKSPITLEGVGHDATIWGFGLMASRTTHVEYANIGIMNFLDDGTSIDTGNMYTWVHNIDYYYGKVGSDGDQAKGDGSLDVKAGSNNNTYSYNHFWDSGKASLCGMKSESADHRITYHHNWFDHSDSRHPRVRTLSVHVYNNYYDGNAKYGIGATMGCSIFAEGNFFRNAHNPMMSSKQGTDARGDGTFSGENGGIIKSYNNKFTENNTNGVKFQFITNKTNPGSNNIDCYEVDNRSDIVPDSVKTIAGGTTYNNFDTMLGDKGLGLTNLPTDPDTAKTYVIKYAGRHNTDFTWAFNNAVDDSSYDVNTALKNAILNYSSKLVSIQTTSYEDTTSPTSPQEKVAVSKTTVKNALSEIDYTPDNTAEQILSEVNTILDTLILVDETTATASIESGDIVVTIQSTSDATVSDTVSISKPTDADYVATVKSILETNDAFTWNTDATTTKPLVDAELQTAEVTNMKTKYGVTIVTTNDDSSVTVTISRGSESDTLKITAFAGFSVIFDGLSAGTHTVNGVKFNGNPKSGVAPKIYNGVTYTTAWKMESKTEFSFNFSDAVKLTIVTDVPTGRIKIDGTSENTDSDGIVQKNLPAGPHLLTKDSKLNIYALIFSVAD